MLWVRSALIVGAAPGGVTWVCALAGMEAFTPWENSKAVWGGGQQLAAGQRKLQRGHRWLNLMKVVLTEPYLPYAPHVLYPLYFIHDIRPC